MQRDFSLGYILRYVDSKGRNSYLSKNNPNIFREKEQQSKGRGIEVIPIFSFTQDPYEARIFEYGNEAEEFIIHIREKQDKECTMEVAKLVFYELK